MMTLKIGCNMSKSKQQEQDAKEVILILSKQVISDVELKLTQPKWRSVKDIVSDGLYLRLEDGDLEGNSTFTHIKYVDNVWYMDVLQKLDCKGNKKSLFFGPIPKAPKKKKR